LKDMGVDMGVDMFGIGYDIVVCRWLLYGLWLRYVIIWIGKIMLAGMHVFQTVSKGITPHPNTHPTLTTPYRHSTNTFTQRTPSPHSATHGAQHYLRSAKMNVVHELSTEYLGNAI
jgi:hypothetical protein